MDKKYFLSFVEEAIFAPGYSGWAGGRMEIYTDESPYAIDEIRFFTPRTVEWIHFREKYDFEEEVDEETLKKVVDTINIKYNQPYVPLGESDDGEKEESQVSGRVKSLNYVTETASVLSFKNVTETGSNFSKRSTFND